MASNIIVKVSRKALETFRNGGSTTVDLPVNPHWNRKLKNPNTGRFYPGLRVIVRSYEKEPGFVVSAKGESISMNGDRYRIELKDTRILLPPFNHQLINEPRRNSIR